MPGLYEAVLLADYAYKYNSTPPINWEKIACSYDKNNLKSETLGYLGVMLVNTNTREVAIAHRGTEWKEIDRSRPVKTPINNLKSDITIFLHQLPSETLLALEFSKKIPSTYADYSVVHIGHSLGGFHAHICGYNNKQKVIAFDPPGSLFHLQQVFPLLDEEQKSNHISLVVQENIINVVNAHFGNVYVKKGSSNSSSAFKIADVGLIGAVKFSHSLHNFTEIIASSASDPFNHIPEAFISLAEYEALMNKAQYKTLRTGTAEFPSTARQCILM